MGLLLSGVRCTSASPPTPPAATAETTNKKKVKTEQDSRTTTDDDDDLNTDEDTTSDDDDDDTDDDDDEGSTDPFIGLLHADKLKECHDSKQVYDRRTASDDDDGSCHDAKYPADFECTKSGITKAFNSSANIKKYLDTQSSDDFKIDQCGNYDNGNPIVFFIKKVGTDADAQLRVRVVEPN